jgi:hypothetical protein
LYLFWCSIIQSWANDSLRLIIYQSYKLKKKNLQPKGSLYIAKLCSSFFC